MAINSKQRAFIQDMDQKMGDHDGWLAMVMFGRETLMEDQEVLIAIILNEVRREEARLLGANDKSADPVVIFARILRETKLALRVAD